MPAHILLVENFNLFALPKSTWDPKGKGTHMNSECA